MDKDDFDKFVKDTLKLLTGTSAAEVSESLDNAKTSSPIAREEMALLCVTAAVGVRKNIDDLDKDIIEDITSEDIKPFRIGTRYNFGKLCCAGHMILEVANGPEVKPIQDAMIRRIGAKSVFSMLMVPASVSQTRGKILSENKAKWGNFDVKNIQNFLKGTRYLV